MGEQLGTVNTIGQPPMGYERDGEVKVFTLIVQPVEGLVTDSNPVYWEAIPEKDRWLYKQAEPIVQKIKGWGVNGISPGPTIEVTEGDRVRFIVKNELPEPTSMHWHGLLVPNSQDGAGGVTQYPIMPGETYTYEFTLYQSGTYLYHSGFNITKQDAYGIGGMFIVHPRDPPRKIDRDFAILLTQAHIDPGSDAPQPMTMDPNWFMMNGHAAPSIPMLTCHQGEMVRIRFGNLSMMSHPIHIHGYRWNVVGTEGGPIPPSAQWPGSTINVAPGETRDVEFLAWNPGLWRLHCHKLQHVVNGYRMMVFPIVPHGGMFTYVNVIPTDPCAPWQPPPEEWR